ncbi:MAG: DUF4177 domain-containing protein [Chloroflexi bacterium]|nr:DUF4177 domain-containing protein [Chloroflexota bacterium]
MKWEYKTLILRAKGFVGGKIDEDKLQETINDWGLQGWELAAAVTTNQMQGQTRSLIVFFKRPR